MLRSLVHKVFPNVTEQQLIHDILEIRQQILTARVRQALLKEDDWLETHLNNERIAQLEADLNETFFLFTANYSDVSEKIGIRSLREKEDTIHGPLYMRRAKQSNSLEHAKLTSLSVLSSTSARPFYHLQYPTRIPLVDGYQPPWNYTYPDGVQSIMHPAYTFSTSSPMGSTNSHLPQYADQAVRFFPLAVHSNSNIAESKSPLSMKLLETDLPLELAIQRSQSKEINGYENNWEKSEFVKATELPRKINTHILNDINIKDNIATR